MFSGLFNSLLVLKLSASYETHELVFIEPARTSRNVFQSRKVYILSITDQQSGRTARGECAPLSLLSVDDLPQYENRLAEMVKEINRKGKVPLLTDAAQWPSLVFGLETALQELSSSVSEILWDTPFSRGESGIPINGLVWMNTIDAMETQALKKLQAGYGCMKFKVGTFDFEEEWNMISRLRQRYPKAIFRLDANGAYSTYEAAAKLERWTELNIHSIEQPIETGHWDELAKLCAENIVPIALDEELIGKDLEEYGEMLAHIQPQYVIFKPSLLGGFKACEERITLAESNGIGWWVTSALEGNIGLRAIAQWTSSLPYKGHQGLGTGMLYENNIPSGLHIEGDYLFHTPNQ